MSIQSLDEKGARMIITPLLVWVENERSVTIAKFITPNKEYVLKATKDGKLILT
jgi:hypothetical protein